MKTTIQLHMASEEKPPVNKTVLVHGGVAYWDGTQWRSRMGKDEGHPILWDVVFWAYLPSLQ
jgi:hypothetical protein